jgi:DNA-directed RNA polymerase subunit K/omega
MSSEEEEDFEMFEVTNIIKNNFDDINIFNNDYEEKKKTYKTSVYLNKYEKTKIISERTQQLANNSKPLIANPQNYSNIYEIALEELKQYKIPFILKRPINNTFEYWKLEDLKIL